MNPLNYIIIFALLELVAVGRVLGEESDDAIDSLTEETCSKKVSLSVFYNPKN